MGNRGSKDVEKEKERESQYHENKDKGSDEACPKPNGRAVLPTNNGVERDESAEHSITLPSGSLPQKDEASERDECEREEVVLTLVLCCGDTAQRNILRFPRGIPRTGEGLKNVIQSEYSIPTPCQKIYFESTPILDRDSLRYCRIRDGDTLHVHYDSTGDVDDILSMVSAMKDVLKFIQMIQPYLANTKKYTCEMDDKFNAAIKTQIFHNLANCNLSFSMRKRHRVNVVFLSSIGGISILSQLYNSVQKHWWEYTPKAMQLLENAILSVVWKISATSATRVVFLGTTMCDNVVESALRGKVTPREKISARMLMLPKRYPQQHGYLAQVIEKAIGTLCNLAEVPQYRLKFASNKALMRQFSSLLLSPSFPYNSQLMAVAGFIGIAYSPETHCHLVHEDILRNVLLACNVPSFTSERLLMRYFSAIFFSFLLSTAAPLIHEVFLQNILSFLQDFLKEAQPQALQAEEIAYHYGWSSILPHIALVYHPNTPTSSLTTTTMSVRQTIIPTLHNCAVEIGVLSLQTMMLSEYARDNIQAQEIEEYIQCMPWHLPKGTPAHSRACQLTSLLQGMLRHPPSLLKITQTKLATVHFGLEYILSSKPHQLIYIP